MPAQRTPTTDATPLAIIKAIDAQRARLPHCAVQLMPAQADVARAALQREVDAQAARMEELEAARRMVAEQDKRTDPLVPAGTRARTKREGKAVGELVP